MPKRIDLQERMIIQDLLDHGTELKDIANILHRSPSAIRAEIRGAGGIRHYNAEIAQEKSDQRAKEGNKNKNTPLMHLTKRVEILEQQLKTIMENK